MPSSKGDQSVRIGAGVVKLFSAVVAFSGGIGVITAPVRGKSFTVDAGLIDRGDLTSWWTKRQLGPDVHDPKINALQSLSCTKTSGLSYVQFSVLVFLPYNIRISWEGQHLIIPQIYTCSWDTSNAAPHFHPQTV